MKIRANIFPRPRESEAWNFTFPPSPAGAIPSEVFDKDKTLHLNGATIALAYYGPSHTDGDISAYFVEADVLHTGDTWWNGRYPFIDYSTGGNIKGMIKAAEANLARLTEKTIVIPGHGKIGGKPEMTEYRDMLVTIHDRVAAMKKEGKSLDEIVAAKLTKVRQQMGRLLCHWRRLHQIGLRRSLTWRSRPDSPLFS